MSMSQGDNRLGLHTGFPAVAPLCPCQPWRDFFLWSPTTEELGAAARGRRRRGLRRKETTEHSPRRTLAPDVL